MTLNSVSPELAAAAWAMAALPPARSGPSWRRCGTGCGPAPCPSPSCRGSDRGPAALARYRLRPVPWGWLAVLVTGWLLAPGSWSNSPSTRA